MEQGPLTFEAYLAQHAPGPDLAAALAVIDPEKLSGYDAVWYLRAEYRQAAHQNGRVHRAVATVARRGADEERRAGPDEWSAHEVKAALGLTRYHANTLVAEAWDITDRCPEIGDAMAAGEPGRRRHARHRRHHRQPRPPLGNLGHLGLRRRRPTTAVLTRRPQ